MIAIRALLALTVLCLSVIRVEAVVLCAKPRGDGTFSTTVKIREACTPREIALDPIALGLQGPSGLQGPTGPVGPQGPPGSTAVVRDSADQLVGALLQVRPVLNAQEAPDTVAIVRDIGATNVWFLVERTSFIFDRIILSYESTDCSGQSFGSRAAFQTNAELRAPFVPRGLMQPGTQVLVYQTGDLRSVTVRSTGILSDAAECLAQRGVFSPPHGCCLGQYAPVSLDAAPFSSHDLGSLGLTPPFRVQGP